MRILLLLVTMCFSLLTYVFSQEQFIDYPAHDLSGGVNLRYADNLIRDNQSSDCQNVMWDEKAGITKVPGYSYVSSRPGIAYGIDTYVKQDGSSYLIKFSTVCVEVSPDGIEWEVIISTLNKNYKVKGTTFNDKYIFTNGRDPVYSWEDRKSVV